jgi:hypothetical protein
VAAFPYYSTEFIAPGEAGKIREARLTINCLLPPASSFRIDAIEDHLFRGDGIGVGPEKIKICFVIADRRLLAEPSL